MHQQMLQSEFAGFNVAVLKAATNTSANRNTNDTTAITATAAADFATAFNTAGNHSHHRVRRFRHRGAPQPSPRVAATDTANTTITSIATAATDNTTTANAKPIIKHCRRRNHYHHLCHTTHKPLVE